jgi:AbrB family looped-hinge helix DNA binding protein
MQATIDEQGRVQIPRELRDRLHLSPGDRVDLTLNDNALNLTPISTGAASTQRDVKLVHDGTLVLLAGSAPLTLDDANRALEAGRDERLLRIAAESTESQ